MHMRNSLYGSMTSCICIETHDIEKYLVKIIESWLPKYSSANDVSNNKHIWEKNAMEKGRLILFLTILFYFGECAYAAAYVSETVSFFLFYSVNNNHCSSLWKNTRPMLTLTRLCARLWG